MKIIEVHKYWYERRGAERYVFSLTEELRERGHEVIPFSMHHAENEQSEWAPYFVSNLDTSRMRFMHTFAYVGRACWSFESARAMRALLRDTRPDIVHVHNIYTHLSPSILWEAKRAKVPIVMTVHDYGLVCANYALWSGRESLYPHKLSFKEIARSRYIKNSFAATAGLELIVRIQRMLKLYDGAIDQYIAVSSFVKEVLVHFGIPSEKITVLHPFTSFESASRADMPQGFLYVGALDASKGVETLLHAADSLSEPLYVAGDGPLRDIVKKHPNAKYLGVLSPREVAVQLAHVRAAIVPSVWDEPFGLTALEALLAGTPLITSGRGGLKEIVGGGEYGTLVHADDVDELRHAMQFAINHPEVLEGRAHKAKAWAQNLADPKIHVDKLLALFEANIRHRE